MKQLFLALTLGALAAGSALAQTNSTTPPPPPNGPPPDGGFHHGMGFLTDAEKATLKKAHDDAIAADPSLATEEKSLMDEGMASHDAGTPPSDDFKEKMHAFHDKMDAAMLKADPDVAPVLAKMKAHHHHDGPPPPPPSDT